MLLNLSRTKNERNGPPANPVLLSEMLVSALSCLLLFAQAPRPHGTPSQTAGQELVAKMRNAVRQLGPITVTQQMETPGFPICRGTLKAMQPGLAAASVGWMTAATYQPKLEYHWTNSHKFIYSIAENQVQDGENDDAKLEYEWVGLEAAFSDQNIYQNLKRPHNETFNGQSVFAIEATVGGRDITLYIDRATFLPAGYTMILRGAILPNGKRVDVGAVSTYKNLTTHASLQLTDFAWTPPKTATITKPEAGPKIEIDQGP